MADVLLGRLWLRTVCLGNLLSVSLPRSRAVGIRIAFLLQCTS
jgi:hypothetical protein